MWTSSCSEMADLMLCNAVSCFNAVLTKGLQGLGLPFCPSVGMHRDPRARHQALREHLRDMAWETASRTVDDDDRQTFDEILDSLQDERLIRDDASLFAVEMLGGRVTINFIDGDALWGALQVINYGGGR